MKKISDILCIALLAALGAACNLLDLHGDGDRSRGGTQRPDTTSAGDAGAAAPLFDTVIYAAGVRFPDGYDWRVDTLTSTEKGELVLLRDGDLLAAVPVGYGYNVGADPDMHRISNGHLYTDYSNNSQTVIKCDGKELFRFDGREVVCGFAVSDDVVWTLGQSRSGEGGLFLRKNGKLVYSHPTGTVIGNMSDTYNPSGAIEMRDGKPVFFFHYTGDGVLSQASHCVMVEETLETELEVPRNFTRIMDAKLVDGVPLMAGQMGTTRNIISIVKNGMVVGYTLSGFDRIGNCRIIPLQGDDVLLSGECYHAGLVTGYICDRNGRNLFYDLEGRLIGLYAIPGVDVILSCGANGEDPVITTNGLSKQLIGRFLYISTRCAKLFDRKFYLGLNPSTGERPYILVGKKTVPLNFNGFLTEVSVCVEPHKDNSNGRTE
ncbi:MAG: hypothetical protein IJ151_06305 [Bacteroidales bacterium]|nr:hypothetical protein [Bacteroidales bacterium]